MTIDVIDKKIRRSFSDAADDYDVLTSLHREIGRKLSQKVIDEGEYQTILDVGCGTGWMTNRLSFYLPESKIIGMDFAEGMIKKTCEKYDDLLILQSDAHQLPFKKDIFDMIVSNLAFQWMDDLKGAFNECYRALKDDGKIAMTLFGNHTFCELFDTIKKTKGIGENESLTARLLADGRVIRTALEQAGFCDIHVESEQLKVHFTDMLSLIKWIKDIGANCLGRNVYLGREFLQKANEHYIENYKDQSGVFATLEVIWVQAKK